MWRSLGISYSRYASEMAEILRRCLKEPYRSKLHQRNQVHIKELVFKDGEVQSKEIYERLQKAFDAAKPSQ